jgi:hypothetical protein
MCTHIVIVFTITIYVFAFAAAHAANIKNKDILTSSHFFIPSLLLISLKTYKSASSEVYVNWLHMSTG